MSEFQDIGPKGSESSTHGVDEIAESMALNVFDHAKRFFNGELDRFSATFSAEGINGRANQIFTGFLHLVPDVVRQDLGTELREWRDEKDGLVRAVFSVRTVKFACGSGRTIIAELLGHCSTDAEAEFEPSTIVYKSEIKETPKGHKQPVTAKVKSKALNLLSPRA